MKKDTNKNTTFAEKLKEHTELSKQAEEKAQSLIAQAERAMMDGDKEKTDKLMSEAEMCLETTDKTLREFEVNHNSEFSKLKSNINSE